MFALTELYTPVAHACLLLAGIVVIIVTGRLLRFEHPSATIGFDIRVPLDFLWIDTALWYRHVVPMLVQYSPAMGFVVLGDGVCRAAGDRGDPESHAATETNAGGGGG